MTTSKKYALDLVDAGKGLIMAVLSAVIGGLKSLSDSGPLHISASVVGGFALTGALAYLSMKFFTPAHVTIPISSIDNPAPTYTITPVGQLQSATVELSASPLIPYNPDTPVRVVSAVISPDPVAVPVLAPKIDDPGIMDVSAPIIPEVTEVQAPKVMQ